MGTVTVPVAADEAAVIASLRADPLFMAKLPGEVASVAYVPGKVVRITTKAAPSPATESAPSE